MKIFEYLCPGVVCWALTADFSHADRIVLGGDADQRLSGVVRSIDQAGVVELESPLSAKPLRLKPDALKQIEFAEASGETTRNEMLVVLANGDRLPIQVQSFTREKGLVGEVPAMGTMTLPPSKLASLEFGVESRKITFQGPESPSTWKEITNSVAINDVRFQGGEWRVPGNFDVQRQVPFSKDFVLRFQLEWSKGSQPNFQIYFCGDGKPRTEATDRYYLQFASAGFEIKRESTGEQRFASVMRSNRLPGSFANRSVDVEIHVSRTNRTISLYLDEELEGWGVDPVAVPPGGDFLMLDFNGQSKSYHTFSNLSIRVLDNMRRRHRAEDRGNRDLDGLISRDDDRWSGTLKAIRKTGDGLEVAFESSLSPEPVELLAGEISTIFFRDASADGNPASSAAFRLRLFGEGSLAVSSCQVAGEKVTALHPLLGEITLPKSCIQRIERMESENNPDRSR